MTRFFGRSAIFTPVFGGSCVTLRLKTKIVCVALRAGRSVTREKSGVTREKRSVTRILRGLRVQFTVRKRQKLRFAPPPLVSFRERRYASFGDHTRNATRVFGPLKLTLEITYGELEMVNRSITLILICLNYTIAVINYEPGGRLY